MKTKIHTTEEVIITVKSLLNSWKKSCINIKNEVNVEFLADLEITLGKLPKKVPKHVRCNCGHVAADHYPNSGYCHHGKDKSEGPFGCSKGCTKYIPNDKWLIKQQKKKLKQIK